MLHLQLRTWLMTHSWEDREEKKRKKLILSNVWSSLSYKLITDCLKSFEFLWAFKKPSSLAMKSWNWFDLLRTFLFGLGFWDRVQGRSSSSIQIQALMRWGQILASKVFLSKLSFLINAISKIFGLTLNFPVFMSWAVFTLPKSFHEWLLNIIAPTQF